MSIEEIYKSGGIELLFRRGLLSTNVALYFKYNDTYLKHRAEGRGYNLAITLTAEEWITSTSTVKRAIKALH